MAQEAMPWEEYQSAPATGQGVVIPNKAPTPIEQSNAGINVSSEARQGREEVRKTILDLQTRYRSDENVKKYEGALPNYVAALKTQPNGSGDLSLVYHYAKTIDPNSTVGTGDMQSISTTDARLPAAAQDVLRQLRLADGKFTNEARDGLRVELRNIIEQRKQAYDVSRQMYAETAQAPEFGVNPALVIGQTSFGDRFAPEIEKYWSTKGPNPGGVPVALEAGATFSTEQDKAIMQATQQAFESGADVAGIVAAAQAAGGNVTPQDVADIQQAVEARARGQAVNFIPARSGKRGPLAQAAGEALMTPVGTALTGAVNAAGVGLLSQVAGDQVQGLEALNPYSGMAGEVVGSALGTAGIAKAAGAIASMIPGLAGRVAGGGAAGMVGREVAKDATYGGIYAGNTGEDIGTGVALGAAGSLGGQALAAGARRAAPVVSGMFRRGGDVPLDGGVPPAGGGMPPVGGAPAGGMPSGGGGMTPDVPIAPSQYIAQPPPGAPLPSAGEAAMQVADEPFAPVTFRSNDAGSAGTPLDLIRATQAAELGIDLMPFQRTRNFQDMQRAHELAKNGEIGLPIRKRLSEQQAAIAQKFDDYIESTGSNIREDIVGQGAKITDAMGKMLNRDKAKVRTLYTRAGKSDEAKTVVPVDQKIKTIVDDEEVETSVVDWLNSQPTGLQTSGVTDAAKQLAVKLGIASLNKKTGNLVAKQPTIKQMEMWRREINQTSDFNDSNLQRQKIVLKRMIDGHTEPYATGLYAEARAARRDVSRKYEDVSTIAQLLKTRKNTPERLIASEKVVESILKGGTSVANVKALRDLIKGEGGDSQAWKEVQGATLEYLRKKAFGSGSQTEGLGGKGVQIDEFGNRTMAVKQFENAVNSLDEAGKLEILLGFEKANAVRNLAGAANAMFTAPPGSVNFSNTSSALWNAADMLLNATLFQLPLPAGVLSNAVKPLKDFVKERPLRQEVSRIVGGSKE